MKIKFTLKRHKKPVSINKISGNIVDVINKRIYPGTIEVKNGKIIKITENNEKYNTFILPGFIDSHIHIESSMLIPSEFARATVRNGMVAVVADPHEIANVTGVSGINYMIKNGKKVPFKFFYGAPACVPATEFETSGAKIGVEEIKELMSRKEITHLGEVMDFPGVIANNAEIMQKIDVAKELNKPIDGHAPGLIGKNLETYIKAGISTDHESYAKEEALEKIKLGMKILIREGSAAKDFNALSSLIEEYPDYCMFSSDDRHPNDLVKGHINLLVKKAISLGYDKMKVLQCACLNPVKHYNLDVGLLQVGDKADFIEINNFEELKILKTIINGQIVSQNGWSLIPKQKTKYINNFNSKLKKQRDFEIIDEAKEIPVIKAFDGLLITEQFTTTPKTEKGLIVADTQNDILKIAVINRYKNSKPAVSFINGFGLKKGAIASSVAHDSHNIVVVGTSDRDITKAVNLIIRNKGGLSVVFDNKEFILPLPVAGLMTNKGAFRVANEYNKLEAVAKSLGGQLNDPFMTLSFMALLVIPELKLSDKGLFDVNKFTFVE